MFCKKCHYSLENLLGPPHRCPECGRAFDPKNPATFASPASPSGALLCGTFSSYYVILLLVVMLHVKYWPGKQIDLVRFGSFAGVLLPPLAIGTILLIKRSLLAWLSYVVIVGAALTLLFYPELWRT